MRKIILTAVLIFSLLLLMGLGLNFSDRFNNFIFANIINPYNPLDIKDSVKTEAKVEQDYWQDPRGLFPIFAYNVPDSTKDLSTSLRIIEQGGINIVINANLSWMPDPYKVKKAFEKLGNTDLRWLVILVNKCNNDFIFGNTDDETNAHIKKYLKDFNNKYVYGWYVWDEPGKNRKSCSPFNLVPNDDNADINRMVKQIRSDSAYNTKLDFVNLYPTYWDGTPDAKAYEKYIDAFISSQQFKPRVLSFDNYPFLKSKFGGFRKDYYLNLSIIRKKALEYNNPFWLMLLSSEHLDYKSPTFEEISMQVYSALAYGAKGIGYYIYSKSWGNNDHKSWILENFVDNDSVADSLHGPLYLPVKRLNEQVQALGKTLLNLESVEVIHSSDYPNNQKDISESILNKERPDLFIKSIINADDLNSDPKVLVGILREKSNNDTTGVYLLVVNKDVDNVVKVNVLLQKESRIYKFNNDFGDKKFFNLSDTLEANILPGSGELFYCE